LGIILGDAAQTVIIPLTKKINIGKDSSAALTFESALSDVLCIVGAITVISVINLNTISVTEVSKTILYSFSVGILLGIAGGFIWVSIHKKMDMFSKSYITTIAALIMLYSFVEYLGANGALACLAFGVIIANAPEIFAFFKKTTEESSSPNEKFFYSEISFFVKSFFFVYLGLMINLSELHLILLGFFLTLLIFIVRPLSVKLSGLTKKVSERDRVYVEVLNPKGTSAAVLAQLPLQYGILHAAEISTIIPSVIAFSILICVITVFLASKGYFHGVGQLLDIRPLFSRK
jgi:NhaP-type Na+/H+ or K+/H+ antiporter